MPVMDTMHLLHITIDMADHRGRGMYRSVYKSIGALIS